MREQRFHFYRYLDGRTAFVIFLLGAAFVLLVPRTLIYRGWFALGAFLLSLLFVLVYSRRNWRSTFGGRASMLSMLTTVAYTANVCMYLWFPHDGGLGYPGWEQVTELVYLLIMVTVVYKLFALFRADCPDHRVGEDPTVGRRERP